MRLPAFPHYSLEQVLQCSCLAARLYRLCLSIMCGRIMLVYECSVVSDNKGFVAEGYQQAHRFSTFANWIIPGHVMLGRYPYVEPSRCRYHQILGTCNEPPCNTCSLSTGPRKCT